MRPTPDSFLPKSAVAAVVDARHGDPFAVLGPHQAPGGIVVRAFVPGAMRLEVVETTTGDLLGDLARRDPAGFFEGVIEGRPVWLSYRLRATSDAGVVWEFEDPYRFPPVLGPIDDHLMGEGTHHRLWEKLGAHVIEHGGVVGVHFAVWAPNAERIAVIGAFNDWDGRRHPMRQRLGAGVFELFLPSIVEGAPYKYEIRGADGSLLPLKADPFGFFAEYRPGTASRVAKIDDLAWHDAGWLARRADLQTIQAPISIYEVHLGSWARGEDNRFLTYQELGDRLIPYAKDLGFTHLELLPITEHPFDGSWGYQPLGLFAPTSRFGAPQQFARFVDRCHEADLGVILDWVPGHFPTDAHGLGQFDGTALYEHADPRQGFHQDWNTLIYNFGRPEVANYLHANALFWLGNYHLDGLRVDAVASMLYLDYSRKHDEWVPNKYGGNENIEAVEFTRKMNELAYGEQPGVMTVAEESTSWPGVSKPTWTGGLGYGFKWNMGWMHDTLDYFSKDPVHRRWHHHQLTFGLLYAFSENFVLPISHDEVVHGKGSLLTRMPGDTWQKFANLRAYFGYMWGHPGKKLLFMGQEFAQGAEWSEQHGLDWHQLDIDYHQGVQDLVRDLNRLYREIPSLHRNDCRSEGFEWIEAGDSEHSTYAFLRLGGRDHPPVMVLCNFTPEPRTDYRIGLPQPGRWREVLNTDAIGYRGSGMGNAGGVESDRTPWHGRPCSALVTLPPLSTLFFVAEEGQSSPGSAM